MQATPANPSTSGPSPVPELPAATAPCAHSVGFSDEQINDWAGLGRSLTAAECRRLQDVLPMASLPDVVNTCAYALFAAAETEKS